MASLLQMFGQPADLIDLEAEELAAILLPWLPTESRAAFTLTGLIHDLYPAAGGGFAAHTKREVTVALAEAIDWLIARGLVMHDPEQSSSWMHLTRLGQRVRVGDAFKAFRKGQVLPAVLLQSALYSKIRHLFLRGDHDTAVFQAFKEIEVAVRRVGGFGDEVVGKALMTRAFNPEDGPLADKSVIKTEREAEMMLFVGAVGHAKNPFSHREVGLSAERSARLIVFASYLLDIVESRGPETEEKR